MRTPGGAADHADGRSPGGPGCAARLPPPCTGSAVRRFAASPGCLLITLLFLISAGRAQSEVLPGIDVLEHQGFQPLQGKRVGVITNQTGRSRDGRSTIDIFHRAPGVTLAALFSPEHGIRGESDQKVAPGSDAGTGLPVYSLYGSTCRPTPEMLQGIDILVFDIQDVGTRFYTYIGTLSLAMRAAREAGIPFVVLDRPNPIGGEGVAGGIPEKLPAEGKGGCGGLTAIHPIPTRHGMTVGELALLFNEAYGIGCELTVVPMQGWRRSMDYDRTGLSWINPSPNMKSPAAALLYPGLGVLETTNLSVARGTDKAFLAYGAPWVDARGLLRNLSLREIPGIAFEECSFTPTAAGHPYRDSLCHGVCVSGIDRDQFDPVLAGLHLVQAFYEVHPGRFKADAGFACEIGDRQAWRLLTRERRSPLEVARLWELPLTQFRNLREKYLLYQ